MKREPLRVEGPCMRCERVGAVQVVYHWLLCRCCAKSFRQAVYYWFNGGLTRKQRRQL